MGNVALVLGNAVNLAIGARHAIIAVVKEL